jgi:hypothetical protein
MAIFKKKTFLEIHENVLHGKMKQNWRYQWKSFLKLHNWMCTFEHGTQELEM